jgi:ferric-dicitrate binding protein FerR (iron transport regulator)
VTGRGSTQFELRLVSDSLRVRVREGEVAIETRTGRLTSSAGEALLVTRSGQTERTRIPTSGAGWEWVTAVAPAFTLEGSTALAFLEWASPEQGWRCEYADAATKRLAERAVLHGSMEALTPEEALAAVLPASGLTSRREGDRLIVGIDR